MLMDRERTTIGCTLVFDDIHGVALPEPGALNLFMHICPETNYGFTMA